MEILDKARKVFKVEKERKEYLGIIVENKFLDLWNELKEDMKKLNSAGIWTDVNIATPFRYLWTASTNETNFGQIHVNPGRHVHVTITVPVRSVDDFSTGMKVKIEVDDRGYNEFTVYTPSAAIELLCRVIAAHEIDKYKAAELLVKNYDTVKCYEEGFVGYGGNFEANPRAHSRICQLADCHLDNDEVVEWLQTHLGFNATRDAIAGLEE